MENQSPHPNEVRMPLWGHLEELRGVLVKSLLAFIAGFAIAYTFSDQIVLFLEKPLLVLLPEGERHLYFTGIADKFMIYLKVSALAALGLVSPVILYQVWRFVSPALYSHERRFAGPFVVFGTVAFVGGLAFGYYVVIPTGYEFLIGFGSPTDKPIITLSEYFDLTLKLMLAMGVVFELPVVLILLGKVGIIQAQSLSRFRRHAYLILSIVAAVATPSPDAFSMVLVFIPLMLLYEISVLGVRWIERGQSRPIT